ncbi:MAG: TonB-dependent receptor [Terriglobales bacterium]
MCATLAAAPLLNVQVTVTDAKAQPVVGATVEVRLAGRIAASATTDDHGIALLELPSAGKYDLTVSRNEYVTTQSTLEVAATGTAQQIEVVLPQSALSQQQIEVTATSSNPTTESSSVPATISASQAKITPEKPATLIDTLPLVPGVVRATDGTVQIAGYGETHSALLINSVNVTDPATGDFGLSIPIDSVETISVSEMPYLAEYGKFTAGVVAAETRRGGEKWDWSLNDPLPDFKIRSLHMQGVRDASPRLNFSGPVIKNKLYFMEGAEYLLYKRQVYTLPYGSNETKSQAINSFSQMDWMISPNHTLTASFHFAPQTLDYAGLNHFNPQPVTPDAGFHESTVTFIDRLSVGGGILQSTFANTHVSSDIRPQTLGEMILSPEGNSGSYFNQQTRRANRYQWLESWKPKTKHWHGDHNLQFGSMVAHSENEGSFSPQPVLIHDTQGNLLQRIDYSGNGAFDLGDTEPAIYAQNHWMVTPHFALDLGLRVEGQTITHTFRSAPRGGFVWTPTKSSNTVIRGGMGIFYDSVPLDIYAFSSYPQQTITTYSSTGAILDGPRTYINIIDQTAERFGFVSRPQVSGNFAPYSLAGNIELEQSIHRFLTLRFKYLQSTAQDRLTIQAQNVGSQGALVLGSAGSAHTRQFEFIARVGAKENRQFIFSYVRQHARGDLNDASAYLGNFPFPIVRQNIVASLPSEVPNRFLLWGSYSLPRKFTVTPKFELRNGFSYQYTDVYQNYIAGFGPQSRFPRYFSLDMRISKDIMVTPKHAIRLSGSVLNLTNHFNALEVHSNTADPLFGTFFGNYSRKFTVDFDFLY